ncbi:transposase [Plantactinospora solaniradicis]|uniref:Transposase n=1 Tax=Plantactinospora solaniradicis TaxID=1723736 RepID=A0ABW1KTL6_9ACTN
MTPGGRLGVLTSDDEGGPTMEAEYDGQQIVGIDLHRRRSVIVRMTEAGERLDSVRIDNDPMALAAEIAKAGEHPQVVLEAAYGWYWAADVLTDAGAQVHLAHPLGVKGFAYRRVKNDVRDASDLAELLRMGRLPEGWIAPPAARSAVSGTPPHCCSVPRWRRRRPPRSPSAPSLQGTTNPR